jgi:putative molybdopterin biosynthesis protein
MKPVELSYAWGGNTALSTPTTALLRNPMMDVLQAVRDQGSISAAARAIGLSYRHVWGQLKAWEQDVGHELIVWERGQAARLSPFGQRLLNAERLAQARLAPQVEHLRAELQQAFAKAIETAAQNSSESIVLYASHDHALSALQAHCAAADESPALPRLHLDIRFCGSVDAIRALNEGRCTLAGFHVQPVCPAPGLSARTYKPLLKPGLHKIIGFALRSQGLMLAPGNPMGIHHLSDVARTGARFVNRARGTGTRLLLEELLLAHGIQASDLQGYEREESSHAAVAQAVADGSADAGLGSQAAAHDMGLDFVPLAQERYALVCLKASLETPAMTHLLAHLRSTAWAQRLQSVRGYAMDHSGEVAAMKRLLPWW